MSEMIDKNLLIICHAYRTYIKDVIEELSMYFNCIYVLVRHNPLFDLACIIRPESFKNKTIDYKIDLTNKPSNIKIIVTKTYYVPLDFLNKKLGDKHFKTVVKQIKKSDIEFDLVHAHFTWSAGYVASKLKENYNVPAIVTAHGYDIYDLPFRKNQWNTKIKNILNNVDYIITVSQRNMDKIRDLNVNTPKKMIPNGYNPELLKTMDKYECRKKLQLPTNKKIILSVGHLTKVKGYIYLINAMDSLLKERNDVISVIIGGGPLKHQLENQIKNIGLENHIKLMGLKPHHEIPVWINACDLVVLPSLNEGNPTVMFETLGCGRPFIGTKVGGIPDIIKDEKLGIVIEPANSIALAHSILKALELKWDENYIINYSRQYTWESIAKEMISIYEEVLENKL